METVIRVVAVYVFIVAGLRVMGKREFSQLSPLELVTLLLVPELVSQGLVREDFSLTNGLIALATLFSLVFLSSVIQYHSKKAATVIQGTPSVLVDHGQLVTINMDQERVGADEIFSEMHRSGIEKLDQVKWAILEPDGRFSFIPFDTVASQTDVELLQDEKEEIM